MAHNTMTPNIVQENISFYAVCSSKLLKDRRINDPARITYLMISSMLNEDGYCYPSDKWLSEQRDLELRIVQDHLKLLEETGYIIRETFQEGLKRKRRIWKPEVYAVYLENSKNVCGIAKNCDSAVAENCGCEVAENCQYNKKEIPIIKNKGGGKTEPPTIVHNSKEKELFGKFVKLTPTEYQTLCDKYTKETVDFNIEKINQKLDARKIKPFEDYALRIESWIKDDAQKGITPKITKKSDGKESERNKKVADFIENKLFEGQMNSTRVYFQAGSQYALIRNIEKDVDIKYFYDKYECENFKNVLLEDCKRYINHNADSFIKGIKPSTINDLGSIGVNIPTTQFKSTESIYGGFKG